MIFEIDQSNLYSKLKLRLLAVMSSLEELVGRVSQRPRLLNYSTIIEVLRFKIDMGLRIDLVFVGRVLVH